MRINLNSNLIFRFGLAHVIALSSVIAIAACQDVTAPESEALAPSTLRLEQSSAADELASIGASFDDLTRSSLIAFPEISQHDNIVASLNSLKSHLISVNIPLIQQDVTQVRGIIDALTLHEQVELGPVTVALNLVQVKAGGGR